MMRSPLRCGVLLLAAVLTLSFQLSAQEAPVLRLSEALEIAREHNPTYRKALTELEVADAAERQALGSLFPRVEATFSTRMSQSRVLSGTDNFGQPIRRADPLIYTGTNSSQSLNLGQITLFDGGAKLRNVRAARASGRAVHSGVEAEAVRLRSRLADRYFEAMKANQQIALEERQLASARDRLRATERLLRVGVKNPVDLLGAEIDVAQREQAVEAARGEARKARLALGEEMGVGHEVTFELGDDLPTLLDPATIDVERLVVAAGARNPIVAQLDARDEAARHRLASSRAARLPSLSAGGYLSRSIGTSGYDAFFDLRPIDQAYGFSLNLSVPLFTQFDTSHKIATARAARLAASEDLRAGRLQLEREIRAAVIDLENAHRKLALAERSAQLSRDRAEMAQEQYTLGGLGFTELQDVVDRAADAERDALTARYESVSALIALEEKVGEVLR